MATPIYYRDINFNFIPNPMTGDIGSFTNESAINVSIKNLVNANVFERFFDPQKAGGIKEMLFELGSPLTLSVIERKITDVIENYEPRVELISVDVDSPADNSLAISIKYYTIIASEPTQFKFLVERVI